MKTNIKKLLKAARIHCIKVIPLCEGIAGITGEPDAALYLAHLIYAAWRNEKTGKWQYSKGNEPGGNEVAPDFQRLRADFGFSLYRLRKARRICVEKGFIREITPARVELYPNIVLAALKRLGKPQENAIPF